MMLGYLLARQGIPVKVLEKHPDFNRDFRGDTVHPSTLEVLKELGLLEQFLKLPHQQVTSAGVLVGGTAFELADFRHVPATCKFIALMPQWDFLNFLSDRARAFPSFELLTEHEVSGLLEEDGRIAGLVAKNGAMGVQIRADLVVGCDGRHSAIRRAAGLELIDYGVPIDVLWFRMSRKPWDPAQVLGNVNYGKVLILIDRTDYFQAGLIIEKGSFERVKERGLDALRDDITCIAPFLADRVGELHDWDQIKILTVEINRLKKWFRPGMVCIGDAAHAMSPAGGVGINLAIQDAVAAANILAEPLKRHAKLNAYLAALQRRREFPARLTQAIQIFAHRRFARVFHNPEPIEAPWQMKAFVRIPGIHRAIGYAIGIGARPEHVQAKKTREIRARRSSFARDAVFAGIGMAATLAAYCRAAYEMSRNKPAKAGPVLQWQERSSGWLQRSEAGRS